MTQARCRVRAWKERMRARGYERIEDERILLLAHEVEADLRWAGHPILLGPTVVDDEDPRLAWRAHWWPFWCDYLAKSLPLVMMRDVNEVQAERIRYLLLRPAELETYKRRVRNWLEQGVDPEERFRIWDELETFYAPA